MRGERQIDDERSEAEQDERGGAGGEFFERNSRPLVGVALGQNFGGELLHGVDGLAGAEAGRGGAVDFSGAEKIVVIDDLGRGALGDGGEIFQRDHGSGIGADIVLADILWIGAELFVGLHVDAIGTVIEIEIVDVGRTHVDAERVGDLAERDVKALGLFAIDGDEVLRIVCGVGGEEAGDIFFRALAGGANQVVGRLVEILEGMRSLIEEFVLETAELAETLDGGRLEGNGDGAGDSEERAAETVDDGGGSMFFALALAVGTEEAGRRGRRWAWRRQS